MLYFDLYMPYDASMEFDAEELADYYANEDEYVDALWTDYNKDKDLVYRAAYTSDYSISNDRIERKYNIKEKIGYSNVKCRLNVPNSIQLEDVDSIIDKFASQKPYLTEFVISSSSEDGKFEEELRQWWIDTHAVLEEGKKRGGEWIDTYVPKKNLKLRFKNKANKIISFYLIDAEIEDRISSRDYVLFVNKMVLER